MNLIIIIIILTFILVTKKHISFIMRKFQIWISRTYNIEVQSPIIRAWEIHQQAQMTTIFLFEFTRHLSALKYGWKLIFITRWGNFKSMLIEKSVGGSQKNRAYIVHVSPQYFIIIKFTTPRHKTEKYMTSSGFPWAKPFFEPLHPEYKNIQKQNENVSLRETFYLELLKNSSPKKVLILRA